jgi:hypothetical protein
MVKPKNNIKTKKLCPSPGTSDKLIEKCKTMEVATIYENQPTSTDSNATIKTRSQIREETTVNNISSKRQKLISNTKPKQQLFGDIRKNGNEETDREKVTQDYSNETNSLNSVNMKTIKSKTLSFVNEKIDDDEDTEEEIASEEEEDIDSKVNNIIPPTNISVVTNQETENTTGIGTSQMVEQHTDEENKSNGYTEVRYRDVKGKGEMKNNLTENEIRALRFYVRTHVFNRIKFIPSGLLGQESKIIINMYDELSVKDDDLRRRKYQGIKYLLQRQMNSKRNYCTEKIVKEIKGMLSCVFKVFFLYSHLLLFYNDA